MKRVHHREIVQLGFNQINVVFPPVSEWDCMGPCYLASDGAPLRSFNHTVGGQWHNQVTFPWLVQEVKCAGAGEREIKAGEGSFITALLFSVCPMHWLISIEDLRVRVNTSHAIRLAGLSLLYSRLCCTTAWTLLLHVSLYWRSNLPQWDFSRFSRWESTWSWPASVYQGKCGPGCWPFLFVFNWKLHFCVSALR